MDRLRDLFVTLVCTLLTWCFKPFRKTPNLPSNPAILVLKPCCLGDLLLATAALAALREHFPASRISLATGAWSRPAVEHNPHLNEILDCGAVGQGSRTGLVDYWRLTQDLRRRSFDIAVVLDRSPLVSFLPFLAGIPVRAGLDSHGRGFSLTHPVAAPPGRHEAQLYLDAVRTLGCQPNHPFLHFATTEADQAWAEQALGRSPNWVAVHPGGGVNPGRSLEGKRWLPERYRAIVTRLLQRGYSVTLAGGVSDQPLARQITAGLEDSAIGTGAGASPCLLDFTGQTTFGQLGAVLQRCQLFLGNDTGPMHLAVAVGTPVVAIFGPSKPEMYGPFSLRAQVVYHGDECRNCAFRGGLVAKCGSNYACTNAVTVEEVWEAMEGMLGTAPTAPPTERSLPAQEGAASI